MNASFDTLVVGSGPAGIAGAVRAAETGRRVGLVDDNLAPGGQIWRRRLGETWPDASHDKSAAEWYGRLEAAKIKRMQGCRVIAAPAAKAVRAEWLDQVIDIEYDHLILATGARERFLPFPGWTLPNIMGAGALQAMVKGGLPIRGKRVVVAGTGPLLLAVASFLRSEGAAVVSIAEQASAARLASFAASLIGDPGRLLQALRYRIPTRRTPLYTCCWPVAAQGTHRVESVVLQRGKQRIELSCDYLAVGFHLVPNIELPVMLDCRITRGTVAVDALQRTSVRDVFCAGEPTGIGGLELSLIEGEIAGYVSSGRAPEAQRLFPRRARLRRFAGRLERTYALRPELKTIVQKDTLVCRCEDVPLSALEPHSSWRSAKLHTRCGMGPCQGRICGAATEFLLGWNADSVRPPLFPALISSLAVAPTSQHQLGEP